MTFSHDAISVAVIAHDDQTDKAGKPYIAHALRVGIRAADLATVNGINPEHAFTVGVLHDVLEDTDWTINDLLREGFSEVVLTALIAMTNAGLPYDEYLDVVMSNPIARLVKIADMEDNLDEDRLAALDLDVAARLREKYTDRLALLRRRVAMARSAPPHPAERVGSLP